MLDAEERYGREHQTKSYPKRKLLPQFDDEALAPIPSRHDQADQLDRPPRGRDKVASNVVYQPAPPHRKGKDIAAQGHKYDLRQDLNKKARQARSIYVSRECVPTRVLGNVAEIQNFPMCHQDQSRRC